MCVCLRVKARDVHWLDLADEQQFRGSASRTATGSLMQLQVAFRASKYDYANGLSVYLPGTSGAPVDRKKRLSIYQTLVFPQATGWDKLLVWLDPDLE